MVVTCPNKHTFPAPKLTGIVGKLQPIVCWECLVLRMIEADPRKEDRNA